MGEDDQMSGLKGRPLGDDVAVDTRPADPGATRPADPGATRPADPGATRPADAHTQGALPGDPPRLSQALQGPPPRDWPELLAQRYRLMAPIGEGGFGSVWRGYDQTLKGPVALKLLKVRRGDEWYAIRQEVVSLRRARLPGLAQLLDEGIEGQCGFIVMTLVEGESFPGAAERSWPGLRPLVLAVLEALARLHAIGLVHRDLKPANVLVDASGGVTVVDLGLTCAADERAELGGFTLAYAAPEQLDPKSTPTRASDQYALGMMIYEIIAGSVPLLGKDVWQTRMLRGHAPPRLEGVPADVADVVARLLAPRPEDRFPSAWAVIEALGGQPDAPPERARTSADTPAALEALFHGPEHFLHIPSLAARVLWARTGGQAEAVQAELSAWIGAGLCWREGDRLRIRRDAIERLEDGLIVESAAPADPPLSAAAQAALTHLRWAWPDTWPVHAVPEQLEAVEALRAAQLVWPLPDGRLGLRPHLPHGDDAARCAYHRILAGRLDDRAARVRHLLAAGANPAELLEDLEELVAEGLPARAWPLVQAAITHAQGATAHRLGELLARLALALEAVEPQEEALLAVQRTRGREDPLEKLVRGWLAYHRGDKQGAQRYLAGVPPWADDDLEQWRCALEVACTYTQGESAVEALLTTLRPWAAVSAGRRALLKGLEGHLRYRQSRFREAASLHADAAEGSRGIRRLKALQQRANALLDGLEPEAADHAADTLFASARAVGHAAFETTAVFLRRSSALRRLEPLLPDPALVAAAGAVRANLEALVAYVEACIAWRAGDLPTCRSLAGHAAQVFARASEPYQAVFCDALRLSAGAQVSEARVAEIIEIAAEVSTAPPGRLPPGIGIQVLALLNHAGLGPFDIPAELLTARPASQHNARLELLSINEALVLGRA